MDEDTFKVEFAQNERIRQSSTASSSEKAAAWRRQAAVLHQRMRDEEPTLAYQLLQEHYKQLNTPTHAAYLDERANAVRTLLAGKSRTVDGDYTSKAFPQLENDLFELACRGSYESCYRREIDEMELVELCKTDTAVDAGSSNGNGSSSVHVGTERKRRNDVSSYFGVQKHQGQLLEVKRDNDLNQSANVEMESKSDNSKTSQNTFRTARELLGLQNLKKTNSTSLSFRQVTPANTANPNSHVNNKNDAYFNYGVTKKMLGSRRTIHSAFVLPINNKASASPTRINSQEPLSSSPISSSPEDERLLNIDPKMVELIRNEIMHKYKAVGWDDIAGLDYAKGIIKEAIVYPLLRPDIFTGLRRPPRGILLFGPPGTGKTLIGKCIASQSQSTFFSISASSLTSKWVGDSEKMVRALFAVAAVHQPAVVFVDEIDSLLAKRSETEHDSSRKLKNEFLVQLDGAATSEDDRILIVGATNRPQELDDAARRRFARRLYIPLPEQEARVKILTNLLQTVSNDLNAADTEKIGQLTEGYSGADMDILCREASMEPLRAIPADEIPYIAKENVRAVNKEDFQKAIQSVRPSVSPEDLQQYIKWNSEYGAARQPR